EITDTGCLFQTELDASFEGPGAAQPILPYEKAEDASPEDELKSLRLLYRDVPSFAVGHGCAADWTGGADPGRATAVRAAGFPGKETPSITPDIKDPVTNELITIPMPQLAGLVEGDDGMSQLAALVDGYEHWIDTEQAPRIESLAPEHQPTAERHLEFCRK